MVRFILAQLRFWSLGSLLIACQPPQEAIPTTRSVDLIAKITENSFTSQYRYDEQGRLIGLITDGSVDSGDYGPNTSHAEYSFVYKPTELVMTYTAIRNGQNLQAEQHIPVNKQGLVAYTPSFICTDRWRAPAAEFSSLLKNFLYPLAPQDTLRQYDSEGYLTQVESIQKSENPGLPNWSLTSRVNQTIQAGNITQFTLITLEVDSDRKSNNTSNRYQMRCTYDKTKSGLRNPYQFMGTTNQNLLQTQELLYSPGNWEIYSYETDTKGRPIRYTIRSTSSDTGITGQIEYVNP